MRAAAIVLAIAGCSYRPTVGMTDDDGPRTDGAETDGFAGSIDVAHLGPDEEVKLTGTAEWAIDADLTIDTETGEIDPSPPAGVVVIPSAVQQDGGPAVMVIQAATITITAQVDIAGTRPLIFVATDKFTLSDKSIDVSAKGSKPGPGGSLGGLGPGAGASGTHDVLADGGAGGASYGNTSPGGQGGAGAASGATGGTPGSAYGGPNVLQGGSGGGTGTSGNLVCDSAGGVGGGALQITAPSIAGTANALINAGGGGGDGGNTCAADGPGGAGGGSGGMIFLDAPMLLGTMKLFALGGGGGEGGEANGSKAGNDGDDAGITSGPGGSTDTNGGDGGRGAGTNPAEPGKVGSVENGNGGGGGGGVGRIYYRHSLTNPFIATPPGDPG